MILISLIYSFIYHLPHTYTHLLIFYSNMWSMRHLAKINFNFMGKIEVIIITGDNLMDCDLITFNGENWFCSFSLSQRRFDESR